MSRLPSEKVPNTGVLIVGNILGKTTIQSSDTNVRIIGSTDPLYCRDVWIGHGFNHLSIKASLLTFSGFDGDLGLDLFDNLNSINSPHIMHAYDCVRGTDERCHETYLALQFFDKTFASFIEEKSMVAENGGFSESFIEVCTDVAKGLLLLHSKGFCCPSLTGKHIAVISEAGHLSAKIWNFSEAENQEAMDRDWVTFANIIEEVSDSHNIAPFEVGDLCTRMKNGELKGLEIFKRSAMISAHKKRDQIIALWVYAEIYIQSPNRHNPFINDPIKSRIHDELVTFLAKDLKWLKDSMPLWIMKVNAIRDLKESSTQTGMNLLYELRSMLEHENHYLPPNDSSEPVRSTLQEEFSKAWGVHLLNFHNFAADLQLEY